MKKVNEWPPGLSDDTKRKLDEFIEFCQYWEISEQEILRAYNEINKFLNLIV